MIIHQQESNKSWADTSKERYVYFKNAIKSLDYNKGIIEKGGYEIVELSQSPFSNSVYLYLCISVKKLGVKIRISDHKSPSCDACVTDDYASRFGFFFLKKSDIDIFEDIEKDKIEL